MNKKRLLKLADFLETVPRNNFDMDNWVATLATKPEGSRPGECGFAGCALGWAAHAKLFKGLRTTGFNLSYEGYVKDGFIIAEELFGISWGESLELFDSDCYSASNPNPTPKQVAKRIRSFVGHEAVKENSSTVGTKP